MKTKKKIKEKKRNFSFFYARGGSGYVRGHQMAQYLGGKENPTKGFRNDICIYVKITPPENHPKHSYSDVDDSWQVAEWLKKHPEMGVIAIAETAKDHLEKLLGRQDIIFIPHQHVNYERWLRPNRPVKKVGIIGSIGSFQYPIDKLRKELADIGLELVYNEKFWQTYGKDPNREMRLKVCDFYKSIDIQIVWRPTYRYSLEGPFKNPNKLENAGAFGIPTVSFPEPSFVRAWNRCFIQVNSVRRLIKVCDRLKNDPRYYRWYSKKALARAEDYHIEKIAKLYLKLK
jgi:hypothetical protein